METRQESTTQEQIAKVASVASPLNTLGYIVFFIVVLQGALLMGINLYQDAQIDRSTEKIAEYSAKLNDADHRTINTQITDVLKGQNQLIAALDSKVRWSTVYNLVNLSTPKNITITSFNVSDTGSYRADGQTRSLSDLAQLLVAWKTGENSPFATVNLSSNGYSDNAGVRLVTFSISGQIDINKVRGR